MTMDRGRRRLDFEFLLLDGFSALSQITATETLRIASRFCPERKIRWRCLSVDGLPVRSGQGTPVEVAGGLAQRGSPGGIAVVVGEMISGRYPTLGSLAGLGAKRVTARWLGAFARRR